MLMGITKRTGLKILFTAVALILYAGTAVFYPAHAQQDIDNLTPETLDDLIRMYEKNVTQEDILRVEKIINENLPEIKKVYDEYAAEVGLQYPMPSVRLYGYRGINPPSGCGELVLENALYCVPDNAIYYDVIYIASLLKTVGGKTGTDGMYAPLTAIGHEMGHAADYMLKWGPMPSVFDDGSIVITDVSVLRLIRGTEKRADCFAGAAVAAIVKEKTAGDDTPAKEKTKTDALDEGRLTLLAVQGERPNEYYLSGKKRMELFKKGYDNGADVCHNLGKSMVEDVLDRTE
jgi:predicted metalloprotease